VRLLGATQAIIGGYHNMFLTTPELPPRPPAAVVPTMLADHGVTLADVDVVATYDACSANVVFDVESIGLCEPGEGVDWVQGPPVPVNTSGGLLAEVYLQGMNHVVELVRQLRGTAPMQVEGAEVGLATGPAVTSAALFAGGSER
jgi:acetyl-CoA acetyltransferase